MLKALEFVCFNTGQNKNLQILILERILVMQSYHKDVYIHDEL